MTIVTVLTDFGSRDGYVAAMKGVILGIAPDARVVDSAHEVEPGDVEAGAWILSQYWELYPEGTVHLVVVDPGVGSERRAIAVLAHGRACVAPDNGVLTRVLDGARDWSAVELTERRYLRSRISSTFHGRDVFAPAAAHLAAGVPLERLGEGIDVPVRLPLERPLREADRLRGRVAHVDRFGNLISDIPASWAGPRWRFQVSERGVGRLQRSYSAVDPGALVVVEGSLGTIEVAVRDGSAARKLGVGRGARVLGWREEEASTGG